MPHPPMGFHDYILENLSSALIIGKCESKLSALSSATPSFTSLSSSWLPFTLLVLALGSDYLFHHRSMTVLNGNSLSASIWQLLRFVLLQKFLSVRWCSPPLSGRTFGWRVSLWNSPCLLPSMRQRHLFRYAFHLIFVLLLQISFGSICAVTTFSRLIFRPCSTLGG